MLALSTSKFGCQRRFFYSSAPSLAYVGVCTHLWNWNAFPPSCFYIDGGCCLKKPRRFLQDFQRNYSPLLRVCSLFFYSFKFEFSEQFSVVLFSDIAKQPSVVIFSEELVVAIYFLTEYQATSVSNNVNFRQISCLNILGFIFQSIMAQGNITGFHNIFTYPFLKVKLSKIILFIYF